MHIKLNISQYKCNKSVYIYICTESKQAFNPAIKYAIISKALFPYINRANGCLLFSYEKGATFMKSKHTLCIWLCLLSCSWVISSELEILQCCIITMYRNKVEYITFKMKIKEISLPYLLFRSLKL